VICYFEDIALFSQNLGHLEYPHMFGYIYMAWVVFDNLEGVALSLCGHNNGGYHVK
jgi:hypothetical protein